MKYLEKEAQEIGSMALALKQGPGPPSPLFTSMYESITCYNLFFLQRIIEGPFLWPRVPPIELLARRPNNIRMDVDCCIKGEKLGTRVHR